jgi:hypothetical protein
MPGIIVDYFITLSQIFEMDSIHLFKYQTNIIINKIFINVSIMLRVDFQNLSTVEESSNHVNVPLV